MQTIMVDMDNVITQGSFSTILEDYLGYKPDYSAVKGYYVQDILGDKKEDFFKYFVTRNLYENATLLPDCYNVLKKLNNYYKIYICTDYIWREVISYAGDNLKNKYEFLYKELDFIDPQNFIFVCDKSIINCDIKIDDRPHNLKGAKKKILFTAYHNKEMKERELKKDNLIRANNWLDIENILLNDIEDKKEV